MQSHIKMRSSANGIVTKHFFKRRKKIIGLTPSFCFKLFFASIFIIAILPHSSNSQRKITFHITAFSFAISISSPFDMVIIFWSGENVNNDILCFPNSTTDQKQDDKMMSIFAKIKIVYLILLTRTMILFHSTIL